MAFVTAQGVSDVAIAMLRRKIVLPATVTTIPGADFAGRNGDTVTVAVPQPTSARVQSTPGATITYDDLDEIPVDVTMTHLYSAHRITDEEANFELVNFARQILVPQVDAVARGAEDEIAEAMNDLDVSLDIQFAEDGTDEDTKATILAMRAFLIGNGAPPDDLFLALPPDLSGRVLSLLTPLQWTGPESAFRNAILGNVLGFTVVESNALEADAAVAYHRSAFVFANKTPLAPKGAGVESATTTEGGIGIRSILHYDPNVLSEASVLSTFAGAAAVYEGESSPPTPVRFVKVGTAS